MFISLFLQGKRLDSTSTHSILKMQFEVMDKAVKEGMQKMSEQYSASSGNKCIISISDQLQRITSPPTKFLWTHSRPSKIQLFFWKAFADALWIVDNFILAISNYPLSNSNPENAARISLLYLVTVTYWYIGPNVFDPTGIKYHLVIALY